ncbi:MAG: 30S ribosomal protein S11 [Candidatus Moanabacter tarae]|uniref:Small ribosomal subunit protein uS11 n=1 Tax=Candidatus Moanibacter tarae TaxID=2200854 RepID=A0A2Z4AP16_9BACT|nr:MAG: 30S ribosomal protein S11 [Candidatus Moanabacter tarae]|tara:strand:+ start:16845 stop:17453 length:609 start_codon:yes stop_codon:yes gene_type:complete
MTEEKNEKAEEPQEGASQAGSEVDKSQEGQSGDGGKNGENVESVKAGPETIKEEEKSGDQPRSEETAADLLKDDLDDIKIRRAKGSKNISSGVVNILATFNNTKVTICDQRGNVISWSSAGKCGFRGSRKSTAYAAQVVTQDAGRVAMGHGLREVEVKVRGPGMGRDSAIRSLQALGLNVLSIIDVTPVPHNGCRPPKRRRV